jgi:hypothetical protein
MAAYFTKPTLRRNRVEFSKALSSAKKSAISRTMAGWNISTDNDGNPILPCSQILSGRRFALKTGPDVNHPARAIAVGANAFALAYEKATKAIHTWRADMEDSGDSAREASRTFEALCYKAAEYFDAYSELPKSIIALRQPPGNAAFKEFSKVLKACSRDWSLVCNRIKHNQNMLIAARYTYASLFETLEVIALLRPVGADGLEVNRDLHKHGTRSIPLVIAMRQMLHDMIRTDRAAGRLMTSLPEDMDASPFPDHSVNLRVGSAMRTIESWPLWTLAEGPAMVDTFNASGNAIHSLRVAAIRQRQDAKVTMIYHGDGITRTLPMI